MFSKEPEDFMKRIKAEMASLKELVSLSSDSATIANSLAAKLQNFCHHVTTYRTLLGKTRSSFERSIAYGVKNFLPSYYGNSKLKFIDTLVSLNRNIDGSKKEVNLYSHTLIGATFAEYANFFQDFYSIQAQKLQDNWKPSTAPTFSNR